MESSNVRQMTKSEASTTTTSFSAVAAAATADPEASIRERLAKLKERDKGMISLNHLIIFRNSTSIFIVFS